MIGKVLAVIWICIAIIGVIGFFAWNMPVNVQYQKTFGSHVTMAKDQATFEGMKEQLLIIWTNMNETFKDYDYTNTYPSPFFWDFIYENSLAAQQDYFKQIVNRINLYQDTYTQQMKNNTNPVYLTDWYDKSIQNLRIEMAREGDLDWALKPAYIYNIHAALWWATGIWMLLFAIFTIAILLYMMSQS